MEGLGAGDQCIHDAVYELAVFEHAAPEQTLADKTNLLQDAHGPRVPLEHRRLQPGEGKCALEVVDHGSSRCGSDTFVPVCLTKPVPELRRALRNSLAGDGTDAANGLTLKLDRQMKAG